MEYTCTLILNKPTDYSVCVPFGTSVLYSHLQLASVYFPLIAVFRTSLLQTLCKLDVVLKIA